jgi:hypothetical protein
MAIHERTTNLLTTSTTDANAVNEVQTLSLSAGAEADTFKLTQATVESSAVTIPSGGYANVTAAQIKTALLTITQWVSKTADIAVVKAGNDYAITFSGTLGGQQIGAITVTSKTGAADGTVAETTPGRAAATATIALGGKYAQVLRLRVGLFEDAATNDIVITDAAGRTVLSKTGLDFDVSSALYDKFIGHDGKDQAGNAAADVLEGVFESPVTAYVRTDVASRTGSIKLYTKAGRGSSPVLRKRSSGTLVCSAGGAATGTVSLGSSFGIVRRIKLLGFDSSTDYVITDGYGATVFSKTGLDGTAVGPPTGVDFAVGYDGLDQSGNAAADTLVGCFKSPLDVTIANGGNATTGSVTVWVEG